MDFAPRARFREAGSEIVSPSPTTVYHALAFVSNGAPVLPARPGRRARPRALAPPGGLLAQQLSGHLGIRPPTPDVPRHAVGPPVEALPAPFAPWGDPAAVGIWLSVVILAATAQLINHFVTPRTMATIQTPQAIGIITAATARSKSRIFIWAPGNTGICRQSFARTGANTGIPDNISRRPIPVSPRSWSGDCPPSRKPRPVSAPLSSAE